MSVDLGLLLDLPKLFLHPKFMVITSDDVNNSSFILHSLIQNKSRSLRADASCGPLLLILLNQSYSHYSSVAAKSFGINLKALKETGRLMVIDVVKDFNDYLKPEQEGYFDLKKLQSDVVSLLNQHSKDGERNETATLIIDDISVFSSLGLPDRDVYNFLMKLRSLCALHPFTLIVKSSVVESHEKEDDSRPEIIDCLIASSDVYVSFEKLQTGFSDKVDGCLFLHDFHKQTKLTKDVSVKYHFKTIERNTKIFAPGTL